MRFVAWRGLSDGYRKAAEGHSPWSRDEKNPQPIYSGNIAGSDPSEALKQAIGRETIGAEAFGRRPIGTGMYKMAQDWTRDQPVRLVANETYWDGPPSLPRCER